jgi:hypothetical protein
VRVLMWRRRVVNQIAEAGRLHVLSKHSSGRAGGHNLWMLIGLRARRLDVGDYLKDSSLVLACFSSLHYTHHGTVYCSTFALIYAKALYCVSESTKSCTVAG